MEVTAEAFEGFSKHLIVEHLFSPLTCNNQVGEYFLHQKHSDIQC